MKNNRASNRESMLTFLHDNLGKKRLKHTLRVEEMAIQLAEHYHEDQEKASIASLLHDCAKELPPSKMYEKAKSLIEQENLPEAYHSAGTAIWHGLAAATIAQETFHIQDKEILMAMAYHTTGWYEMTPLMQIVYTADYIELGRDFKQVKKARRLAFKDLDRVTIFQMKHSLLHLIEKEKPVFIESMSIYNHWINHGR